MPTAGYWEPDEPRGSRPVLRERGGKTPPRHSPNTWACLNLDMTERLYYQDSFLYEFDATVLDAVAVSRTDSRTAIILDRTAFYPASGGQICDTGWVWPDQAHEESHKLRIAEVAELDDGTILHILESTAQPVRGIRLRGLIDRDRRRDHMQQHSGQHVLSAAFLGLFNMRTVSFHMGDDYCSIDLDTKSLSTPEAESTEALANDIVTENRPVEIHFVTQEAARALGLRKQPPVEKDHVRLIDIREFDLTPCGGTHVRSTAQIGCILLRKVVKVHQGWRIEFACGKRALEAARRDYAMLADAAGMLSTHLWDVPQQVRKLREESRALSKSRAQLLEELASVHAERLLSETKESDGRKVVARTFPDRDLNFIKLLAQRLTSRNPATVALLATTSGQAVLVFAQSSGQPFDMAELMKEALTRLGGRGGGSRDMAQGGPTQVDAVENIINELAEKLRPRVR